MVKFQFPNRRPHVFHRRGANCRIKSAEERVIPETSHQTTFRPSLWAISANVAFSASDNNNLSRFNRSKKKRPGAEILTSQNGQDPDAAGPPEIKRR
jgi:hypothetical protein